MILGLDLQQRKQIENRSQSQSHSEIAFASKLSHLEGHSAFLPEFPCKFIAHPGPSGPSHCGGATHSWLRTFLEFLLQNGLYHPYCSLKYSQHGKSFFCKSI